MYVYIPYDSTSLQCNTQFSAQLIAAQLIIRRTDFPTGCGICLHTLNLHSFPTSPKLYIGSLLHALHHLCVTYADPLVFHGKTRARNASEYLRVTEWIVANMSRFSFPVISFCSENDTMCDPDGSKMLIDRNKASSSLAIPDMQIRASLCRLVCVHVAL